MKKKIRVSAMSVVKNFCWFFTLVLLLNYYLYSKVQEARQLAEGSQLIDFYQRGVEPHLNPPQIVSAST